MLDRKFFIASGSGKNRLTDYLAGIMHDARSTTFKYIHGIDAEELDWRPYEGWNTVGALLSHIVAVESYFRITYLERRELNEQEKSMHPAIELGKNAAGLMGKSPAYYYKELMASHNAMKNALQNLPDEKLLQARYDVYDYVNGCNLAWILYHAAEDEIHHRGQISILRKLYQKMKGGEIVKELIERLNKAFENRIRLGIMSALMVNDAVDFLDLKELLDVTDGNLASHISALEKLDYIAVKKEFVGKKTRTSFAATSLGRKEFIYHLNALEKLVNKSRE